MPQLVDVLEFLDGRGDVLAQRMPEAGECEIKWGAQLTVRTSQRAVFLRDGEVVDVFEPGRHRLETKNLPGITKWVTRFAYGPKSPFRAEVYFVAGHRMDFKWGTADPIVLRDADYGVVRVRARGLCQARIVDPVLFLSELVGTCGMYPVARLRDFARAVVVQSLSIVLAERISTIASVASALDEVSASTLDVARLRLAECGIELASCVTHAVTPTAAMADSIDDRSGMNAIGDMDAFLKFKAAQGMQSAGSLGGGASAAAGLAALALANHALPHPSATAVQESPSAPKSARATDPMERMLQLKRLLDAEAITQAEFDAKKAALLQEL